MTAEERGATARLAKFSYGLFYKQVKARRASFENLRIELKKASVPLIVEEYVSLCILAGALGFILASALSLLFLSTIIAINPVFLIPLALVAGVCVGILAFLAGIYSPAWKARSLSKQIDMNLPFATIYMATVAGAGLPAHDLFKLLSRFSEYGPVAREAGTISTETEMFGKDIRQALKRAADRTPNEDFKELLWGMSTIISGGGNLRRFLNVSAKSLMRRYNMRIKEFGNKLSMFLELYLTLVVVGAIFFLILSTILATIGGLPQSILAVQKVVVYFGLPLLTILFIGLIKNISPYG